MGTTLHFLAAETFKTAADWERYAHTTASSQADEQRVSDQQWFDDHPERRLMLRKPRPWEAIVGANAIIVRKITSTRRLKIGVILTGKPINQSVDDWLKGRNSEEYLAHQLGIELPTDWRERNRRIAELED